MSTDQKRNQKLLLSIDQGTTSSRVILFDEEGRSWPQIQKMHTQIFPNAGWCEHDPLEIYARVTEMIEELVAKMPSYNLDPKNIVGIGVTNQRETTIVWDKITGKPLYNAIVWHDTRTKPLVEEFIGRYGNKFAFTPKTGLPFSTYFSGFKLAWLFKNVPEVNAAVAEGRCLFGTIDSWLIWNLTGGKSGGIHITDVTNASRTMLFNIHKLNWDRELCASFGVPMSILPTIKSSSEIYGLVASGPLAGIPVAGCIGDQQSALLGHKAIKDGDAKVTYGTGCFLLMNTGITPILSRHGLVSTVGFKLGVDSPCYYALEGSVATAGAAVQWMTKNFKGLDKPSDIGPLAASVKDTGDIVFVPSFAGFFAPRWISDARASMLGVSLQAEPAHFARALEEAIALQVREVLTVMASDKHISSSIRGATARHAPETPDYSASPSAKSPSCAANASSSAVSIKEEEADAPDNCSVSSNSSHSNPSLVPVSQSSSSHPSDDGSSSPNSIGSLSSSPAFSPNMHRSHPHPSPLTSSPTVSSSSSLSELDDFSSTVFFSSADPPLPQRILVDGGPTDDAFLMQLQADYLGTDVVRPSLIEATALGASIAAGLAVGVWRNVEEMDAMIKREMIVWKPKMKEEERRKKFKQWERAVDSTLNYGISLSGETVDTLN
ncbi:putative Glycerol kinase [Monocercomonoides exilis]|uniref:putative Glycerol kinase n=1 Tax=Monocercomonoides exilis TaxID=2049356 RepID=UPI00355A00E9|nr:putative Glycerol kinase [Monocercomonoides exilis]|eukprot:MONOS_2542.1-p1 / transcript=MONOS_2542.1 / gene=MONOS_2542 / organism=Monocercomonoides_exilis_PA203 / gene_product=Glycerol kinase / transcript_product=Glycerol kinase / location=Mono_scaffold00053:47326-49377(+) / protein_length=663 / sequence_SO=supercontig / SO=protein_coding / is_pseudo=false